MENFQPEMAVQCNKVYVSAAGASRETAHSLILHKLGTREMSNIFLKEIQIRSPKRKHAVGAAFQKYNSRC